MKNDIKSRNDIKLLIDTFYQKVLVDDEIGIYFKEVASADWDRHLQTMYDFWDNILFFSGNYSGNPMHLHKHIHHIHSLQKTHFKKWVDLFVETCNELFAGKNADIAARKAENIATIMEYNIHCKTRLH